MSEPAWRCVCLRVNSHDFGSQSEWQGVEVFRRDVVAPFDFWPCNTDVGVVELQRCFGLWGVEVVDFILEHRCLAKHHEPMGEMARDEKLQGVFRTEFHGEIAP